MNPEEFEKFVVAVEKCLKLMGSGKSWQDAGMEAGAKLPEWMRNDLLRVARAGDGLAKSARAEAATATASAARSMLGVAGQVLTGTPPAPSAP